MGDPSLEPRLRSTILLVEDDAAIAYMLSDVLESSGYIVREASTGAVARALAEQIQPNLIILDLVLLEDAPDQRAVSKVALDQRAPFDRPLVAVDQVVEHDRLKPGLGHALGGVATDVASTAHYEDGHD